MEYRHRLTIVILNRTKHMICHCQFSILSLNVYMYAVNTCTIDLTLTTIVVVLSMNVTSTPLIVLHGLLRQLIRNVHAMIITHTHPHKHTHTHTHTHARAHTQEFDVQVLFLYAQTIVNKCDLHTAISR
jgi:hypothetical protein